MRITKEQKEANRERILATATRLFRERGFDGVGVAELMERAGFTHGGFYNHFRSKEDLIAQACAHGLGENARRQSARDLGAFLDSYLSRAHRDAPGQGCLAAALSGDAARQPDETRAAFAGWVEDTVERFAGAVAPDGATQAEARAAAVGLLAQAVGALVLSRACPDAAPLADEILDAGRAACRASLEERKPAAGPGRGRSPGTPG